MEPDFSGYATKAGLRCTDGRTIMPGAFKHQNQKTVPLVWQHDHNNLENVLGHALLEDRDDGVYVHGFLNNSSRANHARELLRHGDINMLSIWANQLVESAKRVTHGAIKEVSLVLAGANPGALIDNVTIRHSDGDEEILGDEAIVYTGIPLVMHSDLTPDNKEQTQMGGENNEGDEPSIKHEDAPAASAPPSEKTVQDVFDSMTEEQKTVLYFMVGEAIESAGAEGSAPAEHSDIYNDDNNIEHSDEEKGTVMGNVFEQNAGTGSAHVLQHDDIQEIVESAKRGGSLKHAVEEYALSHGIDDINLMFPDAKFVGEQPQILSRRMEWVSKVLGGARKSPFSRIKTIAADITEDEARAKGYVTGDFKYDEFFSIVTRETTPQTIYKKQSLDRDDMLDITDFDIVAFLRAEMRVMLDEEVARAILMGDGRNISHVAKIKEGNIRPIATDHFLYATTININLADVSSNVQELIDALIENRKSYKGSGLPTMFTSETIIAQFLLLKDTLGRQIYKTIAEVAEVLRVAEIVPVEAMDEDPELVAILVNMSDYVVGADKGGEVNMFDDFDIDYNKQKYLLETRISGALSRLKSAIVVRAVEANDVKVVPVAPTYDAESGEVTITNTTGVVYKNAAGATINAAGSPYAVAEGESYTVTATAADGYYFASSEQKSWTFRNRG